MSPYLTVWHGPPPSQRKARAITGLPQISAVRASVPGVPNARPVQRSITGFIELYLLQVLQIPRTHNIAVTKVS